MISEHATQHRRASNVLGFTTKKSKSNLPKKAVIYELALEVLDELPLEEPEPEEELDELLAHGTGCGDAGSASG